MSRNAEVAGLLEEFADLLEARDVDFKPRAYRQAAQNVREYPEPIEELAADGVDAVTDIDRVGEGIAEKIVEYVETGEIEELEAYRAELPVDIEALTSVEGVGPKTVAKLYDALGITSLDELEAAAREGEIRDVEGFGPKTEQNILDNVPFARQAQERDLLGDGRPVADDVVSYLDGATPIQRIDVAGSIRRWRETIGDIDVVAAAADPEAAIDAFVEWPDASEVIESGPAKASVRKNDLRVDFRAVRPEEYGSALQYFTGSQAHNIHLRNMAIDRGLKMNEYGVFDVSDVDDESQRAGERIAGETEASMYEALDLPLIPPEMREDEGEIEAASDGALPDLLTEADVRGDLHVHTEWSDGDDAVAEMVAAAGERGYDYLAISDHATGPGMVGGVGLSDDDVRDQMAEIGAADADADVTVFHGIEANVDDEGGISVDDDLLAELDVVVASPHSSLGQDRETATDRLVAAIEHPHVDVIGHPTGRLINERPGLEFDVERVVDAAVENDTALELNANPHRLDLNDDAVRVAVEAGATLVIDTDAHRTHELDLIRYGVHTARRGWAEAGDVLNTGDAEAIRSFVE